ncbi:class I SAM-dependent methyltransferase [Streptomyces coeruleoprunus]|uniref:Class I SAM-dependent methyltransferase n=1 Tax=Streptomyces coeruleoprunus TaxID=285563 RepID=A0ABV9XH65_9ACTN
MPFDHNDHYHALLTRQIPLHARTALDVGCGTGRFARRLARRGLEVDAVDVSAEVVEAARALSARTEGDGGRGPDGAGGPRFRQADITTAQLAPGHYDFVSCLASLHHMPFAPTLTALRATLAPGGVLAILGCYPESSPADWAWSVAAVPANAAARSAVAAKEYLRGAPRQPVRAPVLAPRMPLSAVRREAADLLPGCRVRRLLFWRYLLVYRKAATVL